MESGQITVLPHRNLSSFAMGNHLLCLKLDALIQRRFPNHFRWRLMFLTDFSQIVPYIGDNQHYSQLLTGLQLGRNYYVHIQVLDRNSY
uniref:Uncharacterized protein n=1 Tax=Parascaris equorum TaxID=6256 RepID=A0A914RMB2_PAREQ